MLRWVFFLGLFSVPFLLLDEPMFDGSISGAKWQ